jgi:DNA-damage-inducible protein J
LCYNKKKGIKMLEVQKIRTNVYLDVALKEQAKEIFKQYGISLSDAFNMFLAQSIFSKGLPFEMKIPNDETLEAMRDIQNGKNYETITLDDLKQ